MKQLPFFVTKNGWDGPGAPAKSPNSDLELKLNFQCSFVFADLNFHLTAQLSGKGKLHFLVIMIPPGLLIPLGGLQFRAECLSFGFPLFFRGRKPLHFPNGKPLGKNPASGLLYDLVV